MYAVDVLRPRLVKLAAVPLKVTAVAPVKLVPVMVTWVPTGPLVGLKDVIVGGTVTVKLMPLVAVPPGVVTWIGPLVAPLGTVAVSWVLDVTVKLAVVPLKVTEVAPVKLVPLIVTWVPTGPLVGEKELILSVTEKGFGKRTPITEYRLQSRAGKGVINVKTTERNGKVVGVLSVAEDSEVMLITQQGKIARLDASSIRESGRSAQGVKLIALEEGDQVAAACLVKIETDGNGGSPPGTLIQ